MALAKIHFSENQIANDSAETILDVLNSQIQASPHSANFYFLDPKNLEADSLTWRELETKAKAIAAILQKNHARHKSVLLLFEPGPDYICAFFGCLWAGAYAVPAYPPLTQDMASNLNHIMDNANVTITLTTKQIISRLRIFNLLSPLSKYVKRILPYKYAQHTHFLDAASTLHRSKLIETDNISDDLAANFKQSSINADDIAYLQYTSGSTNKPKGVIIKHKHLMSNLQQIAISFELNKNDVLVNWLPPYHDMGLVGGILSPIYNGFKCYNLSPFDFLKNPFHWLLAASKYQATIIGGPDFAYRLCMKKISSAEKKQLNLPYLRLIFCGAEKTHADTLFNFYKTFKANKLRPDVFLSCYGLAEAVLLVTGAKKSAEELVKSFDKFALSKGIAKPVSVKHKNARHLVSVGKTVENCLVKIVNKNRIVLPEGHIGEIWINGPNVVSGYWKNPFDSRKTMQATLAKDKRIKFLRTGDLGFMFQDELYITGRIKDMIIIAGVNHFPHDIELDVEKNISQVRHGCVAAFSVEKNFQEVLVVMAEIRQEQARRFAKSDYQTIVGEIKSIIAKHHHIVADEVTLVSPKTLSKTTSGKLRRAHCKFLYENKKIHVLYKN